MQLWCRGYRTGVNGVSGALAEVLGMAFQKRAWDTGEACHVLERELDEASQPKATLVSPDPKVTQSLLQAYGSARRLADSCLRGPSSTSRQQAENTVRHFRTAREALAAYDLQL